MTSIYPNSYPMFPSGLSASGFKFEVVFDILAAKLGVNETDLYHLFNIGLDFFDCLYETIRVFVQIPILLDQQSFSASLSYDAIEQQYEALLGSDVDKEAFNYQVSVDTYISVTWGLYNNLYYTFSSVLQTLPLVDREECDVTEFSMQCYQNTAYCRFTVNQ